MSGDFTGNGQAIAAAAATLRALLGATEQARATLEVLLAADHRARRGALSGDGGGSNNNNNNNNNKRAAAGEARPANEPRYGRAPTGAAAAAGAVELVDAGGAGPLAAERATVAVRFRQTLARMQSVGYAGALDAGGVWPSFVELAEEYHRGAFGRAARVALRFGDGAEGATAPNIVLKRVRLVAPHDAAAIAAGGTTESRLRAEVAALHAVHARLAARLPPAEASAAAAHFPVAYGQWPCAPHDAFIAMSQMRGPTLFRAAAAARAALPAADADRRLLAMLVAAVAPLYALDGVGVVHGDPHSNNVLVAGRGTPEAPFRAQIIDFGRARFVDGRRDDPRALDGLSAPLFAISTTDSDSDDEDGEAERRRWVAADTGCVAQPGSNFVDFVVMLLWQQLLPPHAARAAFETVFTAPAVERLGAELGAYEQGAPHPWGGPACETLWHCYVEGARNNAAGLLAGTHAQTVRAASLFGRLASPYAATQWLNAIFSSESTLSSSSPPQHADKRSRTETAQK